MAQRLPRALTWPIDPYNFSVAGFPSYPEGEAGARLGVRLRPEEYLELRLKQPSD